jgi:hypothetical protein
MICVYGSLDQVKDASLAQFVECPRFVGRELTAFPSLGIQRTSDVTGATVDKGGAPAYVTDRPSSPFQRSPAKGAAILKNGMPFTVVTTACGLERIAPSVLTRRPLAHAAHTFSPSWGECLIGLCKRHGAVTRGP